MLYVLKPVWLPQQQARCRQRGRQYPLPLMQPGHAIATQVDSWGNAVLTGQAQCFIGLHISPSVHYRYAGMRIHVCVEVYALSTVVPVG